MNSRVDIKDDELHPAEEEKEDDGTEGRKRARVEGAADRAGEEEEEARQVRAPPIPDTPSREQVLVHSLTHRPFRSWWRHCVRVTGRAD